MSTAAIYQRLAGDATLTGMLATYAGGPAIFSTDPVPDDAVMPYVVIPPPFTASPWDSKTTRGEQVRRDIRCYAPASGSAKPVDDIAQRVHDLLHRLPLDVGNVVIEASPPSAGPVEDTAYGRIVSLRLLVSV